MSNSNTNQGSSLSSGPTDNTDWRYHERLRIITHDARACNDCSTWIGHFMHSVAIQEQSLLAAEAIRDDNIHGPLQTEAASLNQQAEVLQKEIQSLRKELQHARRDCNETVKGLLQWRKDYNELHDDYDKLKNQTDRTIEELRQRLTEYEHRSTPRRRKAPRQDSGPPSPSPSASVSQS